MRDGGRAANWREIAPETLVRIESVPSGQVSMESASRNAQRGYEHGERPARRGRGRPPLRIVGHRSLPGLHDRAAGMHRRRRLPGVRYLRGRSVRRDVAGGSPARGAHPLARATAVAGDHGDTGGTLGAALQLRARDARTALGRATPARRQERRMSPRGEMPRGDSERRSLATTRKITRRPGSRPSPFSNPGIEEISFSRHSETRKHPPSQTSGQPSITLVSLRSASRRPTDC